MTLHKLPTASELDAWLAGDLDPVAEREFLTRASADPTLSREIEAYRALLGELRALPDELEPRRDLWPGIATRTTRARGARLHLVALAASLLLVVGAALLWRPVGTTAPVGVAVAPQPVTAPPSLELAAYTESDTELAGVRETLRVALAGRELPAETQRVVEENLLTIERALAEIEAALAERPGDRTLSRTYVAYRQRQVDVLRHANTSATHL